MRKMDSLYTETTTGWRVLTKEAQPVPADSVRRPAGQLTDPAYVKRQRMQPEANKLEEYLLQQPQARMRLTDLERNLRMELPAVARGLQKGRTRLRPFLRMFPRIFQVEGGVVVAVNAPAAPQESEPAAPPLGRRHGMSAMQGSTGCWLTAVKGRSADGLGGRRGRGRGWRR